jgi:hypothetical protein
MKARRFLMILAVIIFISGCSGSPKWKTGDVVRTRVGNKQVQVIESECISCCRYKVRFTTPSITTVYMAEYELMDDK